MFSRTARNFNPEVAMAGTVTIAEVEEIVDLGQLDPDEVHLPGIFVDRIVVVPNPEKRIERKSFRTRNL
ncbi:CoA-transferase [Ottowia beijingensis]|uniref:CoA-transferase n=1 Tax=Ottowia beijingensis TaxID=1207057 RepID=UPI0028046900|nr:CoA-transferase [Ottowia beijingensis]